MNRDSMRDKRKLNNLAISLFIKCGFLIYTINLIMLPTSQIVVRLNDLIYLKQQLLLLIMTT